MRFPLSPPFEMQKSRLTAAFRILAPLLHPADHSRLWQAERSSIAASGGALAASARPLCTAQRPRCIAAGAHRRVDTAQWAGGWSGGTRSTALVATARLVT